MFFTLVYIAGAILSYKWMDEKLPNSDDKDKTPFILWSLMWPIFWILAMHNIYYK